MDEMSKYVVKVLSPFFVVGLMLSDVSTWRNIGSMFISFSGVFFVMFFGMKLIPEMSSYLTEKYKKLHR